MATIASTTAAAKAIAGHRNRSSSSNDRIMVTWHQQQHQQQQMQWQEQEQKPRKQTPDLYPILDQCWTTVCDAGPALVQDRFHVCCFLGKQSQRGLKHVRPAVPITLLTSSRAAVVDLGRGVHICAGSGRTPQGQAHTIRSCPPGARKRGGGVRGLG